jgi:hypothetical protein
MTRRCSPPNWPGGQAIYSWSKNAARDLGWTAMKPNRYGRDAAELGIGGLNVDCYNEVARR